MVVVEVTDDVTGLGHFFMVVRVGSQPHRRAQPRTPGATLAHAPDGFAPKLQAAAQKRRLQRGLRRPRASPMASLPISVGCLRRNGSLSMQGGARGEI
jgi:hypothetical protein